MNNPLENKNNACWPMFEDNKKSYKGIIVLITYYKMTYIIWLSYHITVYILGMESKYVKLWVCQFLFSWDLQCHAIFGTTKRGLTNSQPHVDYISQFLYVDLTHNMNHLVAICACGERPRHAMPRPVVLTHLSTCHVPVLGCVSIRLLKRVRYCSGWLHLALLDTLIMRRHIAL